MDMLNDEIIVKRLALLKYLYRTGVEQSYQTEPLSAFSILSLHDAIEMFLKLVCEHKNIKSDKLNFIEYWDKLPDLTLRESMKNLNTRRVNIKHKGLLPSKTDIEVSRVNTSDFFEQNTPIYFCVEFKDVSLLSLLSNLQVKSYLEQAQRAIDNNEYIESIKNSAVAFFILLSSYENTKKMPVVASPYAFSSQRLSRSISPTSTDLESFCKEVANSINNMSYALKILALGLDYKKYAKFALLTPRVFSTVGNPHNFQAMIREKKWTKENCIFCVDFVFESAIKLQEFDFDIHDIQSPHSIYVSLD